MPPPPAVVALVGPDTYLQLAALAEVMRRAGADAVRVDVDGDHADLARVLDEVRSFSMFGGRKVVVVSPADPFVTRYREKLEDYAAAPSDGATLVLRLATMPATTRLYKAVAKHGQVERCEAPKDLSRWIVERGRAGHGLSVQPEAARVLADHVGDDLSKLDNELAKLALSVDGTTVRPEDVAAGVAFQREQQMSEMVNALAAGRTADAVRRWRRLLTLDASAEFKAVTWLGFWLVNVRKAIAMRRAGQAPASIVQQLRIWPREMQGPFMETAAALGEAGSARVVDLLAEVDLQSKTGVGNAADNVERFLIAAGRGRRG
jgi:DNA polymerase-3 subunit delta